jgi:hypothetical protein
MGCGLRWSRVGSTTVLSSSTKFRQVLCCPLLATVNPHHSFPPSLIIPLCIAPSSTLAVRSAMCSFISTNPLLCCDSKVRIVCGSAVEALPEHLWSSCIASLTDLPVVRWTGGVSTGTGGELSNAAGCMVSDRRTWSLRASTDSIDHKLLIFCPDGWGVSCAPLTVGGTMKHEAGGRCKGKGCCRHCTISSNTISIMPYSVFVA